MKTIDELATDPAAFAEGLLGRPLWPHQLEVARSDARFRVICAGRQVGKSSVLAVIALFEAFTRRNILVLIVSAGETASRRLLEECAALASASDLLRGSVLDETKGTLTLSNGSRVLSVPASERQIRGWAVDLLIVDEAAFVAEEVWSAAEPAIIARPGSRVVLTSTPFGTDHFFRRLWSRGMSSPDGMYRSWHWPSSMSPLMDAVLLEEIRQHGSPITFAREYLAEWADASGALLTPAELEGAVLDYRLVGPELAERWHGFSPPGAGGRVLVPQCVAGLDYGSARDASAVAVVAAMDDYGLNRVVGASSDDHVFFLPWLEFHHGWSYQRFGERVAEVACGYNLRMIASETNGVGAGGHEFTALAVARAGESGRLASRFAAMGGFGVAGTYVAPVWTDNRRKQAMFGRLKGMLQAGTMVLPRHPELLRQLAALEMSETPAGSVQISVPERFGHDDLAMALGQALMTLGTLSMHPGQRFRRPPEGVRTVVMPTGKTVPVQPHALQALNPWVFNREARGAEREQPL